jgi:acetolactate synthase II small subunit
MRYQLDFTLRRAEGALIRVIGATERRGFTPLALDGEARPDQDQWRLRLTVQGARSDASLQQQLAKLHDCLSVSVQPCE